MFTYYVVIAGPESYAVSDEKADVEALANRHRIQVHQQDASCCEEAVNIVMDEFQEFTYADARIGPG